MARKPQLTIRQLKKMTLEEQQSLTLKQLRSIIPQAQKLVHSQLNKVRKSGHYPIALEKAAGYSESSGRKNPDLTMVNPKKLNIYEASSLFANLKDALIAETSSVAGAEKVERQQDKLLFGTDRAGRARHRMTPEERKAFWKFYDEFLNQNPAYLYAYRDVMQNLSTFWRESGDYLDYEEVSQMNAFKKRIDQLQEFNIPATPQVNRSGENVFSGHRNSRKR